MHTTSRMIRRAHGLAPVLAVLSFTALVWSSQVRADSEPLSLEDAVDLAVKETPQVAAAVATLEVAQGVLPSAGQLPDPEGRIGAINVPVDSLALDREDMPIPFSVEQQGDSR